MSDGPQDELQWLSDFFSAVDTDKDAMPADVLEKLHSGLTKRFHAPPIKDLEAVLQRAVTLRKARQLLFWPNEEDMQLYPTLLSAPPAGAPDTHPQAKCQMVSLVALYLVHSRSWQRVKPFIEAGGLLQLVALLAHPNLYLASQAMTCLLHITDEELYPWHEPPPLPDGRPPQQGPDAAVWRHMFNLSSSQLIPSLLKHQGPDTFPGSGHLALRLLAFFLSWLRYHFTPDRQLRLSPALLSLLQEWAGREGVDVVERSLAQQLYDDFNRFPPADAANPSSTPMLGSEPGLACLAAQGCGPQAVQGELAVTADRTMVNHQGAPQALALKEQGNAAYKQGQFSQAIQLYSAALDVPVSVADLPTEGSRRAVLLCNRAAAYLARAESGGGLPGEVDAAGLLEGVELGCAEAVRKHYSAALLDAQAALDMDADYLKAHLRKVQALKKLRQHQDALAAAQAGALRAQQATPSGGQQAADVARQLADEIAKINHQIKVDSAMPVRAPGKLDARKTSAAAGPAVVPLAELAQAVKELRSTECSNAEKTKVAGVHSLPNYEEEHVTFQHKLVTAGTSKPMGRRPLITVLADHTEQGEHTSSELPSNLAV